MNSAVTNSWLYERTQGIGRTVWKTCIRFLLLLAFVTIPLYIVPSGIPCDRNGDNQRLSDPYLIMKRYFDAAGGLQKLKAETYLYYKGVYGSGGITGTVEQWYHMPDKWRREVRLMGFYQRSGCNGTFAWEVDRNGKIKIEKSEDVKKRIRVAKLMQAYDYMNPDSTNFSMNLKGVRSVDGIDCYQIRMTNTVNRDIFDYYINTETFLLEKTVSYKTDRDIYIRYSDYRDINGIRRPIRWEVTNLPSGGKYVFQITRAVSDRTIAPSRFEPPAEDVKDFRFLNGRSAEDIPFDFKGNHIMINVEVINVEVEGGGRRIVKRKRVKRKKWLLDSGANATVIDRRYAETLGLKPAGNFRGHGVHNTFSYSYVTGPTLKLPGLVMEKQIIMAIDTEGTRILGYDFLSRFVTKIDYARKRISFYDPDTFQYNGTGKIVPAPLLGKDFTIPAMVDGKYGGQWRVDLGATFTAMHYPFAAGNELLRLPGETVYSQGVGGVSKLRSVKFNHIEVAGHKIPKPQIAIPIQPMSGALLQGSLVGNIGNSVLRHFVIYLDYNNQRIIFEKNR